MTTKDIILKPNMLITIGSTGSIAILKGYEVNVALFIGFNDDREVLIKIGESLAQLLKSEFIINNERFSVFDYSTNKFICRFNESEIEMSIQDIEKKLNMAKGSLKII